ncbi:MAG: choice-of-anchor D domain-containing protein, partial [Candidatus Eisenbacteria sp.]|nr:choice-of-anchor D domain-containing protein [Candidatus Eisenbacteria bacterium]
GGAIATWHHHDRGTGATVLYARRLAPEDPLSGWGPLSFPEFQLDEDIDSPGPFFFEEFPAAAEVTMLVGTNPAGAPRQLAGTQLKVSTGAAYWSSSAISELGGYTPRLRAVSDNQGGAVVARVLVSDRTELWALQVDGETGEVDGSAILAAAPTGMQNLIDLCSAGGGVAYVAGGAGARVFVQRLDTPFPDCPAAATLTAGSVAVCSARDLTLLLTNPSADRSIPLSLALYEETEAWNIVTEPLPQSLAPLASESIALRFAPYVIGVRTDILHVTYGCEVVCEGSGVSPDCHLSPNTISFGTVTRGESAALTDSFYVHNYSAGVLSGDVFLASGTEEGFFVADGAVAYELEAGGEIPIVVGFLYDGAASVECGTRWGLVETGSDCGCPPGTLQVTITDFGSLRAPPSTIAFGSLGIAADPASALPDSTSLVLLNQTDAGCGAWNGHLTLSGLPDPPETGDPAIFATDPLPGQAISIAPQESLIVTVYFRPYGEETYAAELGVVHTEGDLETTAIDFSGTGTYGEAVCAFCTPGVPPDEPLEFGNVVVGDSAVVTLCITNTGGGRLDGSALLEGNGCSAFRLTNPSDSLGHLETDTVRIAFLPPAAASYQCTFDWAGDCTGLGARTLTGTGLAATACRLSPSTLAFGTVLAGETVSRSTWVHNDGAREMTATLETAEIADLGLTPPAESACVTEIGEELQISVAAGDSCSLTFAFTPLETAGGWTIETINQGRLSLGSDCDGLQLQMTGTSINPGICGTNVDYPNEPPTGTVQTIDFGTLFVGTTDSLSFAIENDGLSPCQEISGALTACTPSGQGFSVVGGASYAIACGEVHTVEVAFSPPSAGAFACTLSFGCSADVICTGNGEVATGGCTLTPAETITFGPIGFVEADTVASPYAVYETVQIANSGTLPLSGTIALTGDTLGLALLPPEQVPDGWPQFSLPATGDQLDFQLRFIPRDRSLHEATLLTGSTACGSLPLTAQALHPGDLGGDGLLSLDDFQSLLAHLLLVTPIEEDLISAGLADLNRDSRIDVADLVGLGYALGEVLARDGLAALEGGVPPGPQSPRLALRLTPRASARPGTRAWDLALDLPDGETAVLALFLGNPTAPAGADVALASPPAVTEAPASPFSFQADEAWIACARPEAAGIALVLARAPQAGACSAIGTLVAPAAWLPEASPGERWAGICLVDRAGRFVVDLEAATGLPTAAPAFVRIVPNPATGELGLLLAGPPDEHLRLEVFDLQGRRVARLWEGLLGASQRWIFWSGRDGGGHPVPAGVYFARLQGETSRRIRRVMIVR